MPATPTCKSLTRRSRCWLQRCRRRSRQRQRQNSWPKITRSRPGSPICNPRPRINNCNCSHSKPPSSKNGTKHRKSRWNASCCNSVPNPSSCRETSAPPGSCNENAQHRKVSCSRRTRGRSMPRQRKSWPTRSRDGRLRWRQQHQRVPEVFLAVRRRRRRRPGLVSLR